MPHGDLGFPPIFAIFERCCLRFYGRYRGSTRDKRRCGDLALHAGFV